MCYVTDYFLSFTIQVRGDIARAIMYMAVCYGVSQSGRGLNLHLSDSPNIGMSKKIRKFSRISDPFFVPGFSNLFKSTCFDTSGYSIKSLILVQYAEVEQHYQYNLRSFLLLLTLSSE